MYTAFILFPTALLAEYVLGADEERTAATIQYTDTLSVTAVYFRLLWGSIQLRTAACGEIWTRVLSRR